MNKLDIEIIGHPEEWCRWPFMPVKRWIGGDLQCAVLVATSTPWSATYACNLFAIPPTWGELMAMESHTYATVEALLADGWRVD